MTVFKHAKQVQYQKKKQTIGQISVGFSQIAKAIRQKNTSQETVGSKKNSATKLLRTPPH